MPRHKGAVQNKAADAKATEDKKRKLSQAKTLIQKQDVEDSV